MVLVGVELAVPAGEDVAGLAEEDERLALVHGAVDGVLALLGPGIAWGAMSPRCHLNVTLMSPRCHRDVTEQDVGNPPGGCDVIKTPPGAPQGREGTAWGRGVTTG